MLQPVVQRPGGVTGPLGPWSIGHSTRDLGFRRPLCLDAGGRRTPASDPRGAPTAIAYAGWTFPAVFTTA
jgi:hypothetical protein